jgi:hypothetical protein
LHLKRHNEWELLDGRQTIAKLGERAFYFNRLITKRTKGVVEGGGIRILINPLPGFFPSPVTKIQGRKHEITSERLKPEREKSHPYIR